MKAISFMDHERYADAIERIDAANGADPETEESEGRSWPKALLYGLRMSACLEEKKPDASEALRLAVRCQHIQLWKIPRGDFPVGRLGYRQWRMELAAYHAQTAGGILRDVGYDDAVVERVQSLVRKERSRVDPEAQILEDIACLVFLRYYLPAYAEKHSEEKLVQILSRTWKKMSPMGQAAVQDIELSPALKSLLDRAVRAVRAVRANQRT